MAAAIWTPLKVFIAIRIRPREFDQNVPSNDYIDQLQHDTALQLGVVLIASFLLIPALAEVAMNAGRKARRLAASDATLRRLDTLGAWSLAAGVLGVAFLVMWGVVMGFVVVPFHPILNIIAVVVIVTITVLSALGSFLPQRIMAGKAYGYVSGQPERRRRRSFPAFLAQGASLLILLLWFVLVTLIAEFVATFHLHIVF